jgi:hypothetical protein
MFSMVKGDWADAIQTQQPVMTAALNMAAHSITH